MIHVHLYGKLRRFAAQTASTSDSVMEVRRRGGDTVMSVVARIGIAVEELGSNIFLDGRYASLSSLVPDGSRLGLFPDDMQLLYKWYFAPKPGTGDPKSGEAPESES